ncbi:unnamed protein product [Allacma fusca]|uniref:IgA peptidase M64 n=1 Tax=Allacma fusca TaxID=39272 RepID=A0A8J2NTA9_9HEXA|nr:unnamed protein product [Allacma fusca]
MKAVAAVLVLAQVLAQINGDVHYVKLRQEPNDDHSCIILVDEAIPKFRGFATDDENELKIFMKNAVQGPADSKLAIYDNAKIIEIFARKESIAQAHIDVLCNSKDYVKDLKVTTGVHAPEIVKIIDGGDQRNRIDVVFMGDGYQEAERQEFFDDMTRLTQDMFEGTTFRSYLPVFNIWAIYEASVDSGIGYNSRAKNTPFRLYREGNTLRGIFPGNSAHAREVCRLTGTSGCDYPSIIGNDDFYGGLGGEFVISTRSNRTGTVVLRHEMGHNFVDVGEEYDNGQVYSGVNAARTVAGLGWKAWLSGEQKEELAVYRLAEYPWADLANGAQTFRFTSDGKFKRWYLIVSVSAAGEADSLEFVLDGVALPWQSRGFDDREFYDWYGSEGLSSGSHTFTVRSKTQSTHPQIPRMICSVNLHEFGTEDEFHMDNDYVSAYPTFDIYGRKTFRPTNAGCLMRNMTHQSFCPVCQEGMWMQFLQRISIIDSVNVSSVANPDGTKDVTLNTLKLGALRPERNAVAGETLEVKWSRAGVEREDLRNLFTIQAQPGSWTVAVNFTTPEIRSDPSGLTRETSNFTV